MSFLAPTGRDVHLKAKAKALPRLQGDWADSTLPQFTLGGEPRQFETPKDAEAAVRQYYEDNDFVIGPG